MAPGMLFSFLLVDAALISLPLLYIALVERKRASAAEFGLGAGREWGKDAVIAAKIFLTLMAFSMLVSIAFSLFGIGDLAPVQGAARALAAAPVQIVAYFFVVRVFAEEFFFRAFLVPRIGVAASSAVFAAAHIGYGSVVEVAGALVLGGILGAAYRQYKGLVPNSIAHMLYNFVAVALLA